jgi:hypothetical protein
MKYNRDFLEAAHKHSIFNKEEILQSSLCGCFYCMQNFMPNEIEEWVDDDPKGETALCPKCNIDSVIGDSSSFPVNDEIFLKEMYSEYF